MPAFSQHAHTHTHALYNLHPYLHKPHYTFTTTTLYPKNKTTPPFATANRRGNVKKKNNRTYYILHPVSSPTTLCACGGWSFRKTLYGGDSAPSVLRMPAQRDPTTERASIRAIFTAPGYARRGLGTMMLRHCERAAAAGKPGATAGFSRLEMGATLSGVALYERCGYVRSGREDAVTCPNGERIRILHMTKDLEPGTELAP